jgi:hypothetical protein
MDLIQVAVKESSNNRSITIKNLLDERLLKQFWMNPTINLYTGMGRSHRTAEHYIADNLWNKSIGANKK